MEGTLDVTDAGARLTGAAKVASVDVKDDNLAAHLQGPDFFDAERYPELRFGADRVALDGESVDDPRRALLREGGLAMKVLASSGSLRRDSHNTALLLATPEYNHSVPGALKNALDWLSRPLATSPLRNKPVAVVGASTGIFGAVWAQAELRKVLAATGARVLDRELAVGGAAERIVDGQLGDDEIAAALGEVVHELEAAVHARDPAMTHAAA